MGNAIQYCFERYEKKYFLTPFQQRYLLSQMEPYVKANDYGEYTTCNIYIMIPTIGGLCGNP